MYFHCDLFVRLEYSQLSCDGDFVHTQTRRFPRRSLKRLQSDITKEHSSSYSLAFAHISTQKMQNNLKSRIFFFNLKLARYSLFSYCPGASIHHAAYRMQSSYPTHIVGRMVPEPELEVKLPMKVKLVQTIITPAREYLQMCLIHTSISLIFDEVPRTSPKL